MEATGVERLIEIANDEGSRERVSAINALAKLAGLDAEQEKTEVRVEGLVIIANAEEAKQFLERRTEIATDGKVRIGHVSREAREPLDRQGSQRQDAGQDAEPRTGGKDERGEREVHPPLG